jgi:hypothetical protein
LNQRPHGPQPCALPTAPHPVIFLTKSPFRPLTLDIPRVLQGELSQSVSTDTDILKSLSKLVRKIFYVSAIRDTSNYTIRPLAKSKHPAEYQEDEVHSAGDKRTNQRRSNHHNQKYNDEASAFNHRHKLTYKIRCNRI